MTHVEKEMQHLSGELASMWLLVLSQLEKAKLSFESRDINLAREVIEREERVDSYELQIDRAAENHIARYSPVAIDLRQVLALMSIARHLERIGDFATSIALHTIARDCEDIPQAILQDLGLPQMLEKCHEMLAACHRAYLSGTTVTTSQIMASDQAVHAIYHEAPRKLTEYLTAEPRYIYCGLKLLLLIRKLERIGNHCSNIVEDLVFYIDAKVLKHSHDAEGQGK